MPLNVFISTTSFGTYDPEPLDLLKRSGLQVTLNPVSRTLKADEVIGYTRNCAGIIAGTEFYSRDILSQLSALKVISRCGAGLDGIDLDAADEHGITVTNTPYGPTQAVAELTVGLILSLIRHVDSSSAAMKRGTWEKHMGFLLSEMKIGIMGLGKIGKRVAAILKSFDAEVMGCDVKPDRDWMQTHNIALKEPKDLLRQCDMICLHLPYEPALHHVIGKTQLTEMPSGSYLVNTSRGGLIDEEALHAALKARHLRGAALDTFEREPYQGPLRELDNVILTPHIGSYARAGRVKMERQAAENLIAELRRRKLIGPDGSGGESP